ncbi:BRASSINOSTEROID INSENSITIVE 1-associated receptor kinase 1-like [Chlorella sorokiniana]|uniref:BRASSINOSTEROID INSENSITIVE 1-associated receptor kinase 1-like n=1 Tax=Chlorella sorokiniana TaxID=3076 RepID=A0A2P6TGJ5_CHLSO|nr:BRASSINOSTEROID INSENSITIVE 1-associated receptor kinase 1-like [Chlorella sorokiniana]|eukprot:PRW33244.1 BRASSINOSTEROID INSENSITIVE 1-associated receptor kinase 1-like [Chlorella sorokiniana]
MRQIIHLPGCAALGSDSQAPPPAGPDEAGQSADAGQQGTIPASLSDLLAPLPPSQLTHLSLEWGPLLPPQALQPLSRFARLEYLELEAAQVPPATATALAQLTRLAALRCRVGKVTEPLLGALLSLPRLRQLALEAPRMHPLVGPSLTLITSLQQLHLSSSQLPGDLCDFLATLRHLKRLELDSSESPLPPLGALATLPALRLLALHDRGGCNYGAVVYPPAPAECGGAQMRACAYGPADAPGTGPAVLSIVGLRPGAPTLNLLTQALLPTETPAARLKLVGGGPLPGCGGSSPGALLDASSSSASGSARGGSCSSVGGSESSQGGLLPAALAACPGQLRRLELRGTRLATLPEGPYLAGLRGLTLGREALAAPDLLLAALAAATQLTHLALEIAVLSEEAEGSLWDVLPQLEWLQLGAATAGGTPAGLGKWQAAK